MPRRPILPSRGRISSQLVPQRFSWTVVLGETSSTLCPSCPAFHWHVDHTFRRPARSETVPVSFAAVPDRRAPMAIEPALARRLAFVSSSPLPLTRTRAEHTPLRSRQSKAAVLVAPAACSASSSAARARDWLLVAISRNNHKSRAALATCKRKRSRGEERTRVQSWRRWRARGAQRRRSATAWRTSGRWRSRSSRRRRSSTPASRTSPSRPSRAQTRRKVISCPSIASVSLPPSNPGCLLVGNLYPVLMPWCVFNRNKKKIVSMQRKVNLCIHSASHLSSCAIGFSRTALLFPCQLHLYLYCSFVGVGRSPLLICHCATVRAMLPFFPFQGAEM